MMPRLTIFAGQRFVNLIAMQEVAIGLNGHRRWMCKCDCGAETIATASALYLGKKKSCGCRRALMARTRQTKHGMHGRPTYISWQNMWTRCTNPAFKQYADYGGRGITICDRWRAFENFLQDMGPRQDCMSLDRIDPFGNYEPSNCRWATRSEQARNTRGHAAIRELAKMQAAKEQK